MVFLVSAETKPQPGLSCGHSGFRRESRVQGKPKLKGPMGKTEALLSLLSVSVSVPGKFGQTGREGEFFFLLREVSAPWQNTGGLFAADSSKSGETGSPGILPQPHRRTAG